MSQFTCRIIFLCLYVSCAHRRHSQITRLTDALPIGDDEPDSSAFPIDACQQAYVHIAGEAANCDKSQGTFDLAVEQYISLTKLDQSNKVAAPISCCIPDSPRWKLAKPVPYNKRYAFVTGLLSDIAFDINAAEPNNKQSVIRFGVTVDNIVFLGIHTTGGASAGSTLPNVLDKCESRKIQCSPTLIIFLF